MPGAHQAYQSHQAPQMSSYQGGAAGGGYREAPPPAAGGGGGWNGWDEAGGKDDGGKDDGDWRAPSSKPAGAKADKAKAPGKWAGWDAGDELPDEVWDADWGK